MPIIEGTTGLKTWRGVYSVAADLGTTGTKVFRSSDGAIPSGAVIVGGVFHVTAVPGSGGSATIAITSGQGANDLITATAFDASPFSTTGNKSVVPVFTGTTMITTTAARSPAVVIAAATITLMVAELTLFYF